MRQVRHFQRGSAVYHCRVCKRATRNTGDEGSCRLCAECYELAGMDNEVNDNGYSLADPQHVGIVVRAEALLASIASKGGDVERVKGANDYLWS